MLDMEVSCQVQITSKNHIDIYEMNKASVQQIRTLMPLIDWSSFSICVCCQFGVGGVVPSIHKGVVSQMTLNRKNKTFEEIYNIFVERKLTLDCFL